MRAARLTDVIAASALILLLVACKAPFPTYVDQGNEYDRKSALLLLTQVADAGLADTPVDEAVDKRHDALSGLRSQGAGAAEAATLITKAMPADTAAVPYYVESASYEGTPAVVVLEAVGPKGGKLLDKRVWVLSADGDVLISGTR